jgi:hypothetical protein
MPSTSSIEAGRAFLRLYTEDKEFRRGIDNALRRVQNFGRSLAAIGARIGAAGAAMTAPFAASLKVFADTGSQLHDLSQRTGISVRSLSELKFAAEQSGASLEAIAMAARNMQQNGLDPRTFDEVAARIAAIQDPTQRAQAAFQAFGKTAGSELLPVLTDLESLRQKARDLGLTMSDEAAAKADALGDAMGALKSSVRAVVSAIGEALAPELTRLTDRLTMNTGKIVEWIGENKNLVVSLGAVAAAVTVLGGSLAVVGRSLAAIVGFLRLLTPKGVLVTGAVAGIAAIALALKNMAGDASRALSEISSLPLLLNPYARFRGAPPPVVGGRGKAPVVPSTGFNHLLQQLPETGGGGPFAGFFGPLLSLQAGQMLTQLAGDAAFRAHQKHTLNAGFGRTRERIADEFFGTQGTFSGRFASQILGQPGVTNLMQKHIHETQKTNRLLEHIERAGVKVIGKGIAIGVA